jgi:hypothetical protein
MKVFLHFLLWRQFMYSLGVMSEPIRGCIQKIRTGLLERELQIVQLSATSCNCIAILWVSVVSFAAVTLCVPSHQVFIVVYFVIHSVLCGQSGRGVKLTTHLHLVLRSRMRGAIPPLPQYVSMAWCLVKHRDNFTFTFTSVRKLLYVPSCVCVCVCIYTHTHVCLYVLQICNSVVFPSFMHYCL